MNTSALNRRKWLAHGLGTLAGLGTHGIAPAQALEPRQLRFGVISTGRVEDTKTAWAPFFQDMSEALDLQIQGEYPPLYADVVSGLKNRQIDIAWLSNKAALDAVETAQCDVFAQMEGADGATGYRSLVLTLKEHARLVNVDALFRDASKLRFAIGEKTSTSGYLIPMHGLFGPRDFSPEKRFSKLVSGKHSENLAALLAGAVDACVYNTEELARLRQQDARSAERLRTLWESTQIPKDPLVWRRELPARTRARVASFVLSYGKTPIERAVLKRVFDLAGFRPSTNAQLKPILEIEDFQQKLAIVLDTQTTEATKARRLGELRNRFRALSAVLDGKTTATVLSARL